MIKDRRTFLQHAIGAGILASSPLLQGCNRSFQSETALSGGAETERAHLSPEAPNFIFITVDDLNDWIGVYGTNPDVLTPHIDALARNGVLFTNAHAQAPLCGPSRASLMSGLHPHETGLYGQARDAQLRDAIAAVSPTALMPEYFSNRGYLTAGRGKLFHQGAPDGAFEQFYRSFFDFGPQPAEKYKWSDIRTHTDWGPFPDSDSEMQDIQTAEWGAAFLQQEIDKPFFLGLGLIRPHVPWHVPQKWFDLYDPDALTLPPYLADDLEDVPARARELVDVPQMPTVEWAQETGEWKHIVHAYLASISFVDHCVGLVVDALSRSAYAENTHVVLLSDNGYHIGEKGRFAKKSLWDRSVRVPLIISGPNARGLTINEPVGLIDLYPTLIDLAGFENNPHNSGTSLVPLMEGAEQARQPVLSALGNGNFSVRDDRFRLIQYDDGSREFYDVENDPYEWTNLASDTTFQAEIDHLSTYLPVNPREAVYVPPQGPAVPAK